MNHIVFDNFESKNKTIPPTTCLHTNLRYHISKSRINIHHYESMHHFLIFVERPPVMRGYGKKGTANTPEFSYLS